MLRLALEDYHSFEALSSGLDNIQSFAFEQVQTLNSEYLPSRDQLQELMVTVRAILDVKRRLDMVRLNIVRNNPEHFSHNAASAAEPITLLSV